MSERPNRLLIGCIADDFTGASDIGSFLVKGGLNTILINGIPDMDFNPDPSINSIVIALKTRSIQKDQAVIQTLNAYAFLEKLGCKQVFFKFCSTFDSTPEGNIGPVIDSLIEKTESPYTIVCPALPVNGRKVRDGGLYVNGVPLHESPMKDHPVNPMWDYKISRLMEPQGRYTSLELSAEELKESSEVIWAKLEDYKRSVDDNPFYVIPDYFEEEHGLKISELFKDLPFVSGGSGLAVSLASIQMENISGSNNGAMLRPATGTSGRSIILAGSCSKATREQIQVFNDSGGKSIELDAQEISEKPLLMDQLVAEVQDPQFSDILIHTTGNSEKHDLIANTFMTQSEISDLYENSMALLAEKALKAGVNRIIIAGGETSGAVTERMGFQSFYLGESVAPGVPVLTPVQNKMVRLILKSGNFGQPDFFFRALEITSNE